MRILKLNQPLCGDWAINIPSGSYADDVRILYEDSETLYAVMRVLGRKKAR
jgi:hypothetical protein